MPDYGCYTCKNGDVYCGYWRGGEMEGEGTLTWANGDNYTGEFSAGQMHGLGTLIKSDGTKYTGEWDGGKKHGRGSIVLPTGDMYSGALQCGSFENSFGLITSNTGDSFEVRPRHFVSELDLATSAIDSPIT